MGDKKISNKVLPLDEPYNDSLGFRKHGSASKRQILSIMKHLQKMRPINKAMGGKVKKMKDGGLTILDKTMKPKSEDALGKLSQKDKDDYKEMKDYLKPSVQKQLGNAFKNLTTKSKKNDTQRAIARGQAKQIIRTVGKMDGGVKAQRIAKKGGNPDIQNKMGFVGETRGPKKFKYGGAVNTTRSVQINPFTGEPI